MISANKNRPREHAVDVIVGIQWGDEGKGRIVDYYAQNYDIVARFGGGDNAGHSIIVGDKKLALRIVPSGVMQSRPQLFIGGGTVVSLSGLISELDSLAKAGVDIERIKVSDRAHLVLPYHAVEDRFAEEARGSGALGTTGRGIGPAYVDKVARSGILFADLRNAAAIAQKIRVNLQRQSATQVSPDEVIDETLAARKRLLPHIVDGVDYIHGALERGERILAEGAQGSMLDVGYGTYPYVTSSHTIAGGACIGLGIGPRAIGNVVGVAKAYATRVGAGPFPSELHGAEDEALRASGGEFGTVTGRPRRCGWFDAVAGRYAARLNGLTSVVITKLDVLSGFERIAVVQSYRRRGEPVEFGAVLEGEVETDLRYFEGWREDISQIRRVEDLPLAARAYVDALGEYVEVPIDVVSIGPERLQLATNR